MKYSTELKAKVVSRLMSPGHGSMSELSGEFNVTVATLYNWRKEMLRSGIAVPEEGAAEHWSSAAKARQWVMDFVRWYNVEHRHSAIKFVTPAQRHTGEDQAILLARQALYQQAKTSKPERWSGKTRNWEKPDIVWLNKERQVDNSSKKQFD